MPVTDTLYRARFPLPELIEQGRNNVLKCRVYAATSGSLSAPNSGTVSIYNAAGTAIVNAAAVTVSGSVAQYTLTSATIASESYGEGWRVEWSLAMGDSQTHVFRTTAALVRRQLYPVITEADLYQVQSSLDPSGTAPIHSATAFSEKIDEAWTQIQRRLYEAGNRPNLIISPDALRDVHLFGTLALIFSDFATRLNPVYLETARDYEAKARDAWARVRMDYDPGDTGQASTRNRRGLSPSLWLASRGGDSWPR